MAVLRFPNPVSDVPKFIDVFRILHRDLTADFGHDEVLRVLIKHGLVSSSGTIGEEAIRRSTNKDRSLDRLFNQAKMYSELYRMLGWMHPGADSGHFVFSEIAPYIANERIDSPLIIEGLYSIVFPNPHVENRRGHILRPFTQILRMMRALGGVLSRDELIVGVLSLMDDMVPDVLQNQVEKIKAIRGKRQRLYDGLVVAAGNLQENTLMNYTRFPLGVLKSAGWAKSGHVKGIYERSLWMYQLTADGKKLADDLAQKVDVRHSDLSDFDDNERAAFVLLSQYETIARAGFDLAEVKPHYPELLNMCEGITKSIGCSDFDKILYSPFQQAPAVDLELAKQLDEGLSD